MNTSNNNNEEILNEEVKKENIQKKSSKFNNVLRLLFLFSFGAPAIFFILQRNHQKILWRKIDQGYFKVLDIMTNIVATRYNREFNLEDHVTRFHDASKVITVTSQEVLEFTHQQSCFQKNGSFSIEVYKDFLLKNQMTEKILLKVMEEILIIKKYENLFFNPSKTIQKDNINQAMLNNILKEVLINYFKNSIKNVNFYMSDLNTDKFIPKTFSLEEKQKTYEKFIKDKNLLIYSEKEYHGLLIRKPVSNYEIKINDEIIENYYKKHKSHYTTQTNLHVFLIIHNDKKQLENICNKFYKRELSIEDIKNEYHTEEHKINSLKDQRFMYFKNLLNNFGFYKFAINEFQVNNYVAVAVIREEHLPLEFKEAKPIIINKIKNQQIMEQINDEFNTIKTKNNNPQKISSMENYSIKNKNDPYFSLIKDNFKIENNQVVMFFVKKKIPRKILDFKTVESKISNYLQLKNKNQQQKKFLNNILDKIHKDPNNFDKYVNSDYFSNKKGNITLDNLYSTMKVFNYILSGHRNSVYLNKNRWSIIKSSVNYSKVNGNENMGDSYNSENINILTNLFNGKEININYIKKISYFKSMNKYANKFIETIKDFF